MNIKKLRVILWRLTAIPKGEPENAQFTVIKAVDEDGLRVWFYGDPEGSWLTFREFENYKQRVEACGQLLEWLEKHRKKICAEYRIFGTEEWKEDPDVLSPEDLEKIYKN